MTGYRNTMNILVTGAAGFIGFHAAKRLLKDGHDVVGVDNLNDYYDTNLKHDRLTHLMKFPNFSFHKVELAEKNALSEALQNIAVTHILHLAAQAGVRSSLSNPHKYIDSNVMGHLNVLEYARHSQTLKHMAYASSSSVYGEREAEIGFNEEDPVNKPASLYAATKICGEILSESYAKLYDIPLTGLRFFTVYGPWGRPDMAYWIFTKKILKGEPITLFAPEVMQRDFTFGDDIVDILPRLLASEPDQHKIYNLGNSAPNSLYDLVSSVEGACGRPAKTIIKPQQPGDVRSTFADIRAAHDAFGFAPSVQLNDGISSFVEWYQYWTHSNQLSRSA